MDRVKMEGIKSELNISDHEMEYETYEDQPANVSINAEIAPVIIEELDETQIDSMDVDLGEFVEASALTVDQLPKDMLEASMSYTSGMEHPVESEEQEKLRTAAESKWTKEFLNGDMTFSEYCLRMENNDYFDVETDSLRKNENQEVDRKPSTSASEKPQKPKRAFKRRRNLPLALQGLMGEANLRYARGEIELSAQICMEIIRQVPSAPEPFQTLAMIYEHDQPEKALQFSLIAAHLSPRDANQWVKLAKNSLERGDIKQAITCYSKAIQASPKDATLYEARSELYEAIGDRRAYIRGLTRLLILLGTDDKADVVKFSKMLAKVHSQENNTELALEAMENILAKCPDAITLEEVNIITEMLMTLKRYHKCLRILTRYTGIWVKYKCQHVVLNNYQNEVNMKQQQEQQSTKIDPEREYRLFEAAAEVHDSAACKVEACGIPDIIAVDLKAKFLVTLIELNELGFADQLLPKLLNEENPEVSGDLFLDVAEALMSKKKYERALSLLEPLVNSDNFSLAAVWLRHAECWQACGNLDKAKKSYKIVRKLSPAHLAARLELVKIYELTNKPLKIAALLKQDPKTETIDVGMLYQRTLVLHKLKKYDEYLESGLMLMSRHMVLLRSRSELMSIARATKVQLRLESLQMLRIQRGEKLHDDDMPTFNNRCEPTLTEDFDVFLQMCRVAYRLKKFGWLQRLCFSALTSKKYEKKGSHVMFLCLVSCLHNKDPYFGYNIAREFVRVSRITNYWNLLNVIIQKAEDSRHNRFIMRLLSRQDAFSYLQILHANNCLVSGTYKYALNDYIALFKVGPSSLLALLLAVTLLQMAYQKYAAKKNQLVLQAFAFLKKYSQLRGKDCEQETHYNTARAFHQLGLYPAALHHYKLALETPPPDFNKKNPNFLDLKKEAAFNIHIIYSQAENYTLARKYLEEYVVI